MVDMATRTQFWGLDPVFRANVHLCIKDVLEVEPVEESPGVFMYNNHPFTRVDIQGVLVRIEEKLQFFIYAVDDGTGVINCLYWRPSGAARQIPRGLCPELSGKMAEIYDLKEEASQGFQLGDFLHIRGKLKVYNEEKQIQSIYCVRLQDPNKETERMLKIPLMYERCYNKQAVMPKGIAKIAFQGDPDKIDTQYELETTILKTTTSQNILEMTKEDLFVLDGVRNLLDKIDNVDHALGQVLSNLESAGHLFRKTTLRDREENMYIVTRNCRHLEETVIDSIKRWQPSSDFDDDCPAHQIYSVVRQLLPYSRLEMCALSRCLEKLESQSDIISTADKCYITFNNT